MDYTMADVTDMPEEELAPGTVATLLGADGGERITAEELAGWGGTIPYCVTTGIGSRVGRRYLNSVGVMAPSVPENGFPHGIPCSRS
jgi:alanine racemase